MKKYIIEYGFIGSCNVVGTIEVVAENLNEAIRKAKLERNKVYQVVGVQIYSIL